MPIIKNSNAILDGYDIEFPTVGYVNSYYKVNITLTDQSRLAHPQPQFLPKAKAGTIFNGILDLLGFDVPVLIKTKQEFKGTIAILGQDALRDRKDPLLNGFNSMNDIAVGLPYAIAFNWNYKQVAVYHKLIKGILDAGYNVYLTDIWKSWDMGCVAQNKYKSITSHPNIVEIPVPHLSPAANVTWKDFLKEKPIDETNKIEFVKIKMGKKGVII